MHLSDTIKAKTEFIEESTKDTGRYELYFEWKVKPGEPRSAHVMIVERQKDGNLLWFDPQSGRYGSSAEFKAYLKKAIPIKTSVLRIDDKIMIPLLRESLKGLRVQVYEGEQNLKDWNSGKIDVLIAHPASTAYGLNLQQGGHVVVWTNVGWNLELYLQANARLHRQGQTKPVQVYRLVCPGTVDERALSAINGKQQTQAALLAALSAMVENYTSPPENTPNHEQG